MLKLVNSTLLDQGAWSLKLLVAAFQLKAGKGEQTL